MRLALCILMMFFLVGCYKSPDHFYPLEDKFRHVLPDTYIPGDTLRFLYTDSLSTDTLTFVAQDVSNYLFRSQFYMYDFSDYNEIISQELKAVSGDKNLEILMGTMPDGKSTSAYPCIHIKYGNNWYEDAIQDMSYTDTLTYSMNNHYGYWNGNDKLELVYSSYSGIIEMKHEELGYLIQRIP